MLLLLLHVLNDISLFSFHPDTGGGADHRRGKRRGGRHPPPPFPRTRGGAGK